MTVTLALPDWDAETWKTVGIVAYLLLSYLVLGPLVSRSIYRWEYRKFGRDTDGDCAFFVYILSPVSWVVFVVAYLYMGILYQPLCWLIYGNPSNVSKS